MNNYAPIVLFVYARLWHTQKTIEALQKNYLAPESELYIFSDGAKNETDLIKVNEVRNFIKTISGFKKITLIERDTNVGLANSVINGVTDIVNKYGKIIVLEDDLITSPYFLTYINDGLELYEKSENIYSINGYMFDLIQSEKTTFLSTLATSSWGWGTWANKWQHFQQEVQYKNIIQGSILLKNKFNYGNIDYSSMLNNDNSWAIKWYYSVFIRNGLGLFPTVSLVENIGFDGTGVNYNKNVSDLFTQNICNEKIELIEQKFINLELEGLLYLTISKICSSATSTTLLQKIKNIFY